MSALTERSRLAPAPWLLGLVGLCAAIGVTSGASPKYGFAAVLALIFTAAMLSNLTVGLALFAMLSFLDVLNVGGSAVSFMKVAGLLVFISWLARASTDSRRRTRTLLRDHPVMVAGMVGLVGWSAISAAWAASSGTALTGAYRYLLDLLLIPIAYSAIRERRDAQIVTAGFVLGAVLSGAYGIVNPTGAAPYGGAARLVGALGEANQQATVLVAAIVLCVGLSGAIRRSPALTVAAVLGGITAFVALLQTESRAGLLSFACVLLAGIAVGGRWRRTAAALLLIGVVAVGTYYVVLAPRSAAQRVTSTNTSGRGSLWTVGWRVFTAHPLTGVGANNFPVVSIHYIERPGAITSAIYIVDVPKVVHNIYLEQLADVGIPGLLVVLCIFGAAAGAALKAAHIFERIGDRELELLARCTILALVAFLSADFFASELVSKQLWLVVALCPALYALARSEAQRSSLTS